MKKIFFINLMLVIIFASVSAHEGSGTTSGFLSGFMHPILGWDHVIAMIAVGIWGAFLSKPAIWILPVVFPLVMALGGVLGIAGVPVPSVEIGIALSAVVLGILVAFASKPPIWIAALVIGIFAIFHGHAHGTELPTAANVFAYSIGILLATGLLHIAGIGFGILIKWPAGKVSVRSIGVFISFVGVGFLFGIL